MGMKGAARANTLVNPTFTGVASFADGAVGAPSVAGTNFPTSGMYWVSLGSISTPVITAAGTAMLAFRQGVASLSMNAAHQLAWTTTTAVSGTEDTHIARVAANSLRFGTTLGSNVTSRTEINKAVAAIANAVATDVLTITIPNAAHSASVLVRVTGSIGAGGAIGANEATATNTYVISVSRTAGVNAVAVISSAFGAAASAVAGATTVTATAAMSSVSGAVGATNTFTVQATISRGGGSSTNHTCLVYAQLMNANSSGITLS